MTTIFRRRPRRSNSLKDLQRRLGAARTVYDPRHQRFQAHALALTDAADNYWKIQTLDLFARELGFQFIANDRVFHFLEDRPGAVRAALSDDGPVGGALRHLDGQGLELPRPPRRLEQERADVELARLRAAEPALFEIVEDTSRPLTNRARKIKPLADKWLKLELEEDAIDGELALRRRRATISNEKLNAHIERLRSGDPEWLAALEDIRRVEADRSSISKRKTLRQFDRALAKFDPERHRARLIRDPMRLRIEAIENLRIKFWEEWKPRLQTTTSWQTLATALEEIDQERRSRLYDEWRARGNSDKKPRRRLREVAKAKSRPDTIFDGNDEGLRISFRDVEEDDDGDEDALEYHEVEGDDELLDDEENVEAEEDEDEDLGDEGSADKGLAYRNRRRQGRSRGPASDIRSLDPRIYYDPGFYVIIETIPYRPGKEPTLPQGKWRPKPIDPNLFDPAEDYRRPIRVMWPDKPEPEPRQGMATRELRKEVGKSARIIEIPADWWTSHRCYTTDDLVAYPTIAAPGWNGSRLWSKSSPSRAYLAARSLNVLRL